MSSHPPVKDEVAWFRRPVVEAQGLSGLELADVVIVGGGVMGLNCALALHRAGRRVVVLEKDLCGSGASGRSSGFITPDSELSLAILLDREGEDKARRLWEFACGGVATIRRNIEELGLVCDFEVQDSLFVANHEAAYKTVVHEDQARHTLGYPSRLFTKDTLRTTLDADTLFGGLRYDDTFSIDGFAYCQELKRALVQAGVVIHEHSEAIDITRGEVRTAEGSVHAEHVLVCVDRALPTQGLAARSVSSVQTFLGLTPPLSQTDADRMFPDGRCMVWDTDLIYQYFRLTADRRLLIGASSLVFTYLPRRRRHHDLVLDRMYTYLRQKFPWLEVRIEFLWPGSIGVTKDFLPIVGVDAEHCGITYAGAAAGLPWATAAGNYLADKVTTGRTDLDVDFSPDRKFPVDGWWGRLVPKPLAFALSQAVVKLT